MLTKVLQTLIAKFITLKATIRPQITGHKAAAAKRPHFAHGWSTLSQKYHGKPELKKTFKTCCRMILAIIFLRKELCFAMQKFIQSLSKVSQHVKNKENSFPTVESPFWSLQTQTWTRGRRPYPNFMPLLTLTFFVALKEKQVFLICKLSIRNATLITYPSTSFLWFRPVDMLIAKVGMIRQRLSQKDKIQRILVCIYKIIITQYVHRIF